MRNYPLDLCCFADNSTAEETRLFMDEIRVMKKVSDSENPHILQMIGCVTTTFPPMILLEFVPHGNLKDYLRKLRIVTHVRSSRDNAPPCTLNSNSYTPMD